MLVPTIGPFAVHAKPTRDPRFLCRPLLRWLKTVVSFSFPIAHALVFFFVICAAATLQLVLSMVSGARVDPGIAKNDLNLGFFDLSTKQLRLLS
jgi:hypothetical protein